MGEALVYIIAMHRVGNRVPSQIANALAQNGVFCYRDLADSRCNELNIEYRLQPGYMPGFAWTVFPVKAEVLPADAEVE